MSCQLEVEQANQINYNAAKNSGLHKNTIALKEIVWNEYK